MNWAVALYEEARRSGYVLRVSFFLEKLGFCWAFLELEQQGQGHSAAFRVNGECDWS